MKEESLEDLIKELKEQGLLKDLDAELITKMSKDIKNHLSKFNTDFSSKGSYLWAILYMSLFKDLYNDK